MDNWHSLVVAIASIVNAGAVVVLVGVTWWYARSTNRMLKQMELESLPEWDLHYISTSDHVGLALRNNGLGPARQIRIEFSPKPTDDQLSHEVRGNIDTMFVLPGQSLSVQLSSRNPPYEGDFILHSGGRWGSRTNDRWKIRLEREPVGQNRLLTLTRCERMTKGKAGGVDSRRTSCNG